MGDREADEPEDLEDVRRPNVGIVPVARSAAGLQNVNTLSLFQSPLAKVTLKSVTFTSDHGVIKDNTTDWQDTGALYPRPHWKAAAAGATGSPASPVSHTKGTTVFIDVEVEVSPDNAEDTAVLLAGTATFGGLTLTGMAVLTGGPVTISAVGSVLTLSPDTVGKLTGDIAWKITEVKTSKVHDLGSSTGHTVFATYGTPAAKSGTDAGFTHKRMARAVQEVAKVGSSDPHAIAKALVFMVPGYTLAAEKSLSHVDHPGYHNLVGGAWCLLDHIAKKAECQAIARMAYAIMKAVGCPGQIEVYAVWADPDKAGGTKGIEAVHKSGVGLGTKTKQVGAMSWEAVLVDTYPEEGAVYSDKQGAPNYIGINHLEACLRVEHGGNTRYYAAGAGVYGSPDEVITCFHALCWVTQLIKELPKPEGGVTHVKFITVEKVVKRWIDENGNKIP